jgi:hypothetical protein
VSQIILLISSRFRFLVKADLHHDMIFLMKINFALGALLPGLFTCVGNQIPAGHREIKNSRALFSFFLAAATDAPARGDREQLFYAGYIQAIISEEFPEALEPTKVVVGIKPLAPSSRRPDEPFLLVDSQGSGMNIQKFRYNTNGI